MNYLLIVVKANEAGVLLNISPEEALASFAGEHSEVAASCLIGADLALESADYAVASVILF